MPAVVCLGEALIDLVPVDAGAGSADADCLRKAAGGAPANVAVGLARLGTAAGFIGCVGSDGFGRFLAETLAAHGVDVTGLRTTDAAPTALAVVSLGCGGERDFTFYGHPAAHMMLRPDDIDESAIGDAEILHIGSISLATEPVRSATLHAVDLAERHGVRVSFDPNLRLALWPDAAAAREAMRLGLSRAAIVKMAENEVAFLASACDLVEGARSLWHPGLRVMAVTQGAAGSTWLTPRAHGHVPGFPVTSVDTTGAGDAFMAAFLAGLIDDANLLDDTDKLSHLLLFANAAGALATMQRGAIPALPNRDAVRRLLRDCG